MSKPEERGAALIYWTIFIALPVAIGVGCLVTADYGWLKGVAAGCLIFPVSVIGGMMMLE